MKTLIARARILVPALLLAVGGLGSDCGKATGESGPISQAQTNCQAGQAQILVTDGFYQSLCGCTVNGRVARIGTTERMECTIALGTSVYFIYSRGNTLKHQVEGTGTPYLGQSAISDPGDPVFIPLFAATPGAVGSYEFRDAFHAISGAIIVQ